MSLSAAERTINEGTTPVYVCTIEDASHAMIPLSALTTLTLTLYDVATLGIINTRNAQNVLNANGVTVYETLQTKTVDGVAITYNVEWQMAVVDNAMVGIEAVEKHIGLMEWTWGSGKAGKHEVVVWVRNLAKVPH